MCISNNLMPILFSLNPFFLYERIDFKLVPWPKMYDLLNWWHNRLLIKMKSFGHFLEQNPLKCYFNGCTKILSIYESKPNIYLPTLPPPRPPSLEIYCKRTNLWDGPLILSTCCGLSLVRPANQWKRSDSFLHSR